MDKLLIFLIHFLNIILINGDCKWSANGTSLDLSCLKGKKLSLTKQNNDPDNTVDTFTFSVCGNSANCNGGGDSNKGSAMVAQTNSGNDFCWILGKYQASIAPVLTSDSSSVGGSFLFTYNTGSQGDACSEQYGKLRTWKPTFICKPGVEWETPDQVTEEATCVYDANIYTKYACTASQQSCATDDSSGLSGGWIFIIILICGLFAYFCIGYIVMALTINKQGGFKDFSNNIPNKALWINCPKLVIAGCMVSKEFLVGLANRGGSDKEDTLVEDSGNEETS